MAHCCYILYSPVLDKFYIGETENFSTRLDMHNKGFRDLLQWQMTGECIFSFLVPIKSVAQKIEAHIKAMKSRKYIENLVRYPDIASKLLAKSLAQLVIPMAIGTDS